MNVADVENPNNPADDGAVDLEAAAATRAEPDVQSQLEFACCLSGMGCTVLAASAGLVVLFCRSAHASTAVRVLAGFGLVVGIVGLLFGTCFCVAVARACIRGNCEGTPQAEAPAPRVACC